MDRKAHILQRARRDRHVTVDRLACDLGVSAHTIRRDINHLCEVGKLRRRHGGADYVESSVNLHYRARAVLNLEAKTAIAEAVAGLVPDGATLFISIGTTPALVAGALAHRRGLTVITNNLNAALAVATGEGARLIVPGGEVRLPDCDLLSPAAQELFDGYRADYAIYGVGGIDHDGSLLDFHEAEVRLRERMRAHARAVILVADVTKFGRRAAAVGGRLRDADMLVIDRRPAADFDHLIDAYPGRLVLAQDAVRGPAHG